MSRACRILQRGQILCVLMPWQGFCLCKQGFENNIVSVKMTQPLSPRQLKSPVLSFTRNANNGLVALCFFVFCFLIQHERNNITGKKVRKILNYRNVIPRTFWWGRDKCSITLELDYHNDSTSHRSLLSALLYTYTFTKQHEHCDWLFLDNVPLINFKCSYSCCPLRVFCWIKTARIDFRYVLSQFFLELEVVNWNHWINNIEVNLFMKLESFGRFLSNDNKWVM